VLDLVASDNVILSEHLERIDLVGIDFINEKYFTCFVVNWKEFVGVRARLLVSSSTYSPYIWHKNEKLFHLPNDPLPITLIILNESKRGGDWIGF
jgi:hypothetical protein